MSFHNYSTSKRNELINEIQEFSSEYIAEHSEQEITRRIEDEYYLPRFEKDESREIEWKNTTASQGYVEIIVTYPIKPHKKIPQVADFEPSTREYGGEISLRFDGSNSCYQAYTKISINDTEGQRRIDSCVARIEREIGYKNQDVDRINRELGDIFSRVFDQIKKQRLKEKEVLESWKQKTKFKVVENPKIITPTIKEKEKTPTTIVATPEKTQNKKWDVFISHASEDKIAVAEPLAAKLNNMGLKVWYDQYILRWGDSLMESINRGLKESLFGIVILSKTFFKKRWTQTELQALMSLANSTGEKKILPLLYEISHKEITNEYPILSDIVSRSWDDGLEKLAYEVKELVMEKKSI